MDEGTLHTWQGIEEILHRLTDEQAEPEPWVSYFLTQAIDSVRRGEPNLSALELARLQASERHAHGANLTAAATQTTADLRAAFEALPVPGGHPA